MEIKIKETDEIKRLEIIHIKEGVDFISDLLAQVGIETIEEVVMSKEEFCWWEEYIEALQEANEKLAELSLPKYIEVMKMISGNFDSYPWEVIEVIEGM